MNLTRVLTRETRTIRDKWGTQEVVMATRGTAETGSVEGEVEEEELAIETTITLTTFANRGTSANLALFSNTNAVMDIKV